MSVPRVTQPSTQAPAPARTGVAVIISFLLVMGFAVFVLRDAGHRRGVHMVLAAGLSALRAGSAKMGSSPVSG